MGRGARSVLSRLSPMSWTAAVALAAVQMAGVRVGGPMVIAAALGAAGTVSGAIQATHDGSIDLLLHALLESRQPTPGPLPHRQLAQRRAAA